MKTLILATIALIGLTVAATNVQARPIVAGSGQNYMQGGGG
jgi:hypothetical protein